MTLETLIAAYTARGGVLSGTTLAQTAAGAWGHLCQQTMGRVRECGPELEEAVCNCFFELVDTIQVCGDHGLLTRETVGDWTRTYESSGASPEGRCQAVIRRHLGETGLLYRGWPG